MHPDVLWRQHYGKAALNHSRTTKGLFVLQSVFTHAAFRRGPDNTAATLTFTLHSHCSALVVAQALAERSLYASPQARAYEYVCPAPPHDKCPLALPCEITSTTPPASALPSNVPRLQSKSSSHLTCCWAGKRTSVVGQRGLCWTEWKAYCE